MAPASTRRAGPRRWRRSSGPSQPSSLKITAAWPMSALGVAAVLALSAWGLVDDPKLFIRTALNGITLAALYFVVASGFTLVFGLMRNVNLAHGSLYLLGAYLGFEVGQWTGSWHRPAPSRRNRPPLPAATNRSIGRPRNRDKPPGGTATHGRD